jgi:hypothetical protein
MLLTGMNVCDVFTSHLVRGGHFCSLLEEMPYYGSKGAIKCGNFKLVVL